MTKMRLLALLAVVALVLFPTIAFAETPPTQPCRFYGTVQVDGADVEDGTIITAWIDGNETATTTTPGPAEYGDSSYQISIIEPAGKTFDGKPVTFKIGASGAEQTGTWTLGIGFKLDLSVGEAPVIPGGAIIKSVVLGNSTYYDSATGTLSIKKADITGPAGKDGKDGVAGKDGAAGKDASNVFAIIAIVIAAIALLVAAMVMLRKKPA